MMTPLLDSVGTKYVLMEKKRMPDGEGGWLPTQWTEGAQFENYQALDTSMEARIAEKEGVTSVFSGLVKKDLPIQYGDYFKNTETGVVYRVTSDPDEKKAPKISSLDLKFFTAERSALPQ